MLVGLNLKSSAALYTELSHSAYFVDKTDILRQFIPYFSTDTKYICITRPRRFGKTSIAQMLLAYLCKSVSTDDLFKHLNIAGMPFYKEHLNQHNVVYMDLSKLPSTCTSYRMFEDILIKRLSSDLYKQFPAVFNDESTVLDEYSSIWDLFYTVYISAGE